MRVRLTINTERNQLDRLIHDYLVEKYGDIPIANAVKKELSSIVLDTSNKRRKKPSERAHSKPKIPAQKTSVEDKSIREKKETLKPDDETARPRISIG